VHSLDPISQPEPVPAPLVVPPAASDDCKNVVVDLLDAILVIVFAFGAFVLCAAVAEGILLFVHRAQHLSPEDLTKGFSHNAFFQVPTEFAAYVVLVGFMASLVWSRHRTGLLQAVGWNAPDRKRAFQALAAGVGMAMFSDVAEVLLQEWTPTSLPITEFFRDRPSAFVLAAFGILVAPLMEELIFRGFLYPALARFTGVIPAVIIIGVGFALLHGTQLGYAWAPLLVLLIVGLALTLARVLTKSVAACVLMHMAYNFTLFLQVYIGTQGFRHMQD
jgi:membrane protease YdiL (CAAX protease family)